MTSNEKPSNPKDIIGATKLPIHLWPETATAMGCLALAEGALKYGRSNWRHAGVRASIYVDACRRHLAAWFEGEDVAPDSGIPHLANALACLAIIVDAQANDKLTDDRQYAGPEGYRKLVEEITPLVSHLIELHKDKDPKQYSRVDAPIEPNLIGLPPNAIIIRFKRGLGTATITDPEEIALFHNAVQKRAPLEIAAVWRGRTITGWRFLQDSGWRLL